MLSTLQEIRSARAQTTGAAGVRRRVTGLSLVGLALALGAVLVVADPSPPVGQSTVRAAAVSSGLYAAQSSSVVRQGRWTSVESSHAVGGRFSQLASAGSAQLTFRGTGATWVSRRNSAGGLALVYVDGVRSKQVDLYSRVTRYNQDVFTVSGLSARTTHTIRIERTGQKNRAAVGRNLLLDGFRVRDSRAPAAPTAVAARTGQTGAVVTWTASPDSDVAGYRVFRTLAGQKTETLVGQTTAGVRTLTDVGLPAATQFSFRVRALDSSGNQSGTSAAGAMTTAPRPQPSSLRYANCPAPTVTVSDAAGLAAALGQARAGSVVRLAPGTYSGQFVIRALAPSGQPVWVCGPRTAVVDGGGVANRGGFQVRSSSNVVLAGMTVRNSVKGITVSDSSNVTVTDTRLEQIGDEAIHLMNFTTDSSVTHNVIRGTGVLHPDWGEGIYIGSADSNWCSVSNCRPDRSDRNLILSNDIARTTAESIEAKVATTGGTISGNTIDGTGLRPTSYGLIYVKGNHWTVSGNRGSHAPTDGILVIQRNQGWGLDNVVFGNTFAEAIRGYGVRITPRGLGNILGCGGVTPGAPSGSASEPCQP